MEARNDSLDWVAALMRDVPAHNQTNIHNTCSYHRWIHAK